MIKDILGEILEAKKGKAFTVTINVEPEKETDDEAMAKQGAAPMLKEEKKEEGDVDKDILMNGEEHDMLRKKREGEKPLNLGQRAKMMSLE